MNAQSEEYVVVVECCACTTLTGCACLVLLLFAARELLSQQQQTEAALRGEIVGWKAQAESKDREILALKGEVTDKSTLVGTLR